MDDVRFLKVRDQYGFCSNFWQAKVFYDGLVWQTNEHLYQAQKHRGTPVYQAIHECKTAWAAMKMGRAHPVAVPRWDDLKDDNMRACAFLKFSQNRDIREQLLETGNARIVEAGAHDSYWAEGPNGKGLNRLGAVLMEVRFMLRAHYGTEALSAYVHELGYRCGMRAIKDQDLEDKVWA